MALRLSKKDLLLLKYLFECKFLTREQIGNYIWKDRKENYIYKRIYLLTKAGYIKKMPDPMALNHNKTILQATEKAKITLSLHRNKLQYLTWNDNYKSAYYDPELYYDVQDDELDLKQYEHDRDINNIRFIFEKNGADNWKPHKVIYKDKKFRKKADGAFSKNGIVLAVELEYNLKSSYVLKKIFESYRKMIINKDIHYILYIVKNESIEESMIKNFNPEMILNFVDINDNYNPQRKSIFKKFDKETKEITHYIYKHFTVTTFDKIINENFIFYNKDLELPIKQLLNGS
ncbi:MAG: hypothetical protein ACOCP8_09080 [archaeon]